MVSTPQINIYHCGKFEDIEKFKSGKTQLNISVEEGIWLGNGMYFWDNESNLEYWYSSKKRKEPNEKFTSVKVLVKLDKLLDLTDKKVIDMCKESVQIMRNKGIKGFDKNNDLGRDINMLFKHAPPFNRYEVLKIIGYYERYKGDNFLYETRNKKSTAHPTANAKVIYSLKNREPIIKIYD